ncbi:hypothetical protein CLOSTHATH_00944 [Hungatella hathewayi DSM 13479]|uniref:Uncharacterized protein n=2 Tax=Hungatella hathewayi TaxID=154046 RepID=D3ABG6_9FIRM|nr:hypothetical protein [Hungatella hathewayi]EFD00808.1 hypothetical protein CLOSTHATH_00944 [Hungatella hathewayi DSM 13479]
MTISNFVAYVKQAWKNKPDTSTPLSAARLTHLEDGIKGNSDAIEKIAAAVVSQIVNDPNKIASMASLYSVNQAVTQLNSDLAIVGNVNGMEFGTDGEKRYFVFKHNDGSKSSLEFYNNGVNLVRYNPKTAQWEIIWSIPVTVN